MGIVLYEVCRLYVPQVRMYSRAMAVIGAFLVLASGAGEVYRQKPRTRSLQSTGQVFLGIYLICVVSLFLSKISPIPALFSLISINILGAYKKKKKEFFKGSLDN